MDMKGFYQSIIIDYSKATNNKHEVDPSTFSAEGYNPSCGDDIVLTAYVDDKIKDIAFSGQGCAISQASANIMIDLIKGKTKAEALEIINLFLQLIREDNLSEEDKERLEAAVALEGVKDMPTRVKCATLAWHTLKLELEKL